MCMSYEQRIARGRPSRGHSSLLTISSHLLSKLIISQYIGLGSPTNISFRLNMELFYNFT